jgi:hypothetical protein
LWLAVFARQYFPYDHPLCIIFYNDFGLLTELVLSVKKLSLDPGAGRKAEGTARRSGQRA